MVRPRVLVLTRASDTEIVTKCLKDEFDCVVADEKASLDDARLAFSFFVADADDARLAGDSSPSFPGIVLLDSGQSELARARIAAGRSCVLRGADVEWQLLQATRDALRLRGAHELGATIDGPIVHDLRGALSVIGLATQLLEEASVNKAPLVRINNACRRATWWLEDLKAQTSLHVTDESPKPTPGVNWQNALRARVEETALDHPRRALDFVVEGAPALPASLPHVLLVLGGLLDLAFKTTGSKEPVKIVVSGDARSLELRIEAQGSEPPSPGSRELPPSAWTLGHEHSVPFRIIQAALLAERMNGSVDVTWTDGRLAARAHFTAL